MFRLPSVLSAKNRFMSSDNLPIDENFAER